LPLADDTVPPLSEEDAVFEERILEPSPETMERLRGVEVASDFTQGTQDRAGNGTISNHRQDAEQRVRPPTEIPQVGAAAAFPHRFPTDKTAFPGTRRHTC
jgi:hypothetical protein